MFFCLEDSPLCRLCSAGAGPFVRITWIDLIFSNLMLDPSFSSSSPEPSLSPVCRAVSGAFSGSVCFLWVLLDSGLSSFSRGRLGLFESCSAVWRPNAPRWKLARVIEVFPRVLPCSPYGEGSKVLSLPKTDFPWRQVFPSWSVPAGCGSCIFFTLSRFLFTHCSPVLYARLVPPPPKTACFYLSFSGLDQCPVFGFDASR